MAFLQIWIFDTVTMRTTKDDLFLDQYVYGSRQMRLDQTCILSVPLVFNEERPNFPRLASKLTHRRLLFHMVCTESSHQVSSYTRFMWFIWVIKLKTETEQILMSVMSWYLGGGRFVLICTLGFGQRISTSDLFHLISLTYWSLKSTEAVPFQAL